MIDAKEYTINDLRAHAEYEVFASVPHGLSGSISNIRKGKVKNKYPHVVAVLAAADAGLIDFFE